MRHTNDPLYSGDEQELSEHAQKNLQHMMNVQGMLDRLQSPLFISLQDIQTQQQEVRQNFWLLGPSKLFDTETCMKEKGQYSVRLATHNSKS